jgi:Cytochrome P450
MTFLEAQPSFPIFGGCYENDTKKIIQNNRSLTFGLLDRAITRDPTIYDNPDDFNPDRFLDNDDDKQNKALDPATYIFGFGSR